MIIPIYFRKVLLFYLFRGYKTITANHSYWFHSRLGVSFFCRSPGSASFSVRVFFPRSGGRCVPGMFLTDDASSGRQKNGLAIGTTSKLMARSFAEGGLQPSGVSSPGAAWGYRNKIDCVVLCACCLMSIWETPGRDQP